MCAVLEAHLALMSRARAHGDLRTVKGHAYPISEGSLLAWEAMQKEVRRAKVHAFLKSRTGVRAAADRAFA